MSDAMEMPIEPEDRLYDPPLVDSIYFDESRSGFAITFIPSDYTSRAPTKFVLVSDSQPDYARIRTFWNRIEKLIDGSQSLARAIHSGGGDYTLHLANGATLELASLDNPKASEAADRLKQIADVAEIAFLDQAYRKTA